MPSPGTGRKAASVWHDGVSKPRDGERVGPAGVRILGIFTATQEILIPSLSWTQSTGKKDSLLFRRIFEGTGEKTLHISEQGCKQGPWATDQF